jgi:hypothetical protein
MGPSLAAPIKTAAAAAPIKTAAAAKKPPVAVASKQSVPPKSASSRDTSSKQKEPGQGTSSGEEQHRGAIHQLLSIIPLLRFLVLLPVSAMPYVVIVKNYS